jgi:transposase InsO family protein
MESKKRFIKEWKRGEWTLAELCRRNGVSRPTGYALVQRYEEEGEGGLRERSRAPQHHRQAIAEATKEAVLALRRAHPTWGPKKLRTLLPDGRKPAESSIGELLKREGLSHGRKVRRRTEAYSEPLAHADQPNAVWCADFKGWFHCGDGRRCDPLTITDAYSRYLLRCRGVAKTDGVHVRAIFEAVFRQYGIPWAIRTDNGPPFASSAPAGLSRLSLWWIRLGIRHERIEKGHPEQNGRHERMHRTLRAETANPPQCTYELQQQSFVEFEQEFNFERPHEALGQETPGSVYVASLRPYPFRLSELVYPDGCLMRRVRKGEFSWKHQNVFVSEVLAGEDIGLVLREEDLYEVFYGSMLLGWFAADERKFVAVRAPKPVGRG